MDFLVQILFLMPLILSRASAQTNNATTSVPTPFLPSYCPNKCGNVSIRYPFGIGVGCFRPGFDLICDNSSSAPRLFIDDKRTYQITKIKHPFFSMVYVTTGITIMPSNVDKYNVTWTAPKKGIYSLLGGNNMTVIGCGISVLLTYGNSTIGECSTSCISEESLVIANGSSCLYIGCCQISIPYQIASYTLMLERLEDLNHLPRLYDVKAFVSSDEYIFMSDDVFSRNRFNRRTRVNIVMDWNIPYPQTCQAAKNQPSTYACLAKDSDCYDDIGYSCYCRSPDGNAYIPGGCQGICSNPSPGNKEYGTNIGVVEQ